jgi:putative oxidoreductase
MGKTWNEYASVPLRVLLGFGFAYHGFPKLFSSQGHDMFVGMLHNIGVPAAGLASWLVGIVEFFGGLLLIAGAFVTIISVLGIIDMLVAMFTVHLPNGFNFLNITGMTEAGPTFGMPGYEVNVLYIAGFLALALAGAGALSVDRWLTERRSVGRSPVM